MQRNPCYARLLRIAPHPQKSFSCPFGTIHLVSPNPMKASGGRSRALPVADEARRKPSEQGSARKAPRADAERPLQTAGAEGCQWQMKRDGSPVSKGAPGRPHGPTQRDHCKLRCDPRTPKGFLHSLKQGLCSLLFWRSAPRPPTGDTMPRPTHLPRGAGLPGKAFSPYGSQWLFYVAAGATFFHPRGRWAFLLATQ